ncbi:MAG: ferritin-like domain-containing protein [Kiloniellales bacterium]|nr:ferritin-like domain-containing protein [Kiloniellales bacterium]
MGAAGHSALPPKVAERLRRLAENGTADQWCVDRDIDWSRRERLPLWISRRHAAIAISQLYHGEMATVRLCRRLLGEVEEPLLRRCLTLQIGDEARHAEAYRRYLERLGGVMPVEPALARALDLAGRGTLGTAGTVMAYHIVAEGEVLRLQERLAGFFPCPLLRQVSRRVARDEARHVAFGRLFLEARVSRLSVERRAELYDWARRIWVDCTEATLAAGAGRGPIIQWFVVRWLGGSWRRHEIALGRLGIAPA